jgi:hypothetical protein
MCNSIGTVVPTMIEHIYSTNDNNNSRGPIYAGAAGTVSAGPLQNRSRSAYFVKIFTSPKSREVLLYF